MILENKEPLKVMFGGLGRTGSHSIAAALNRLGFKACHGSDIVKNLMGSHHNLAKAMIRGNVQEIFDATSALGYNATMEAHSVFWEYVLKNEENYKDTKFIFTTRDFDSWFDSFVAMRHATRVMNRFPLRLIPFFELQTKWSSALSARQFQLDGSVDPVDFIYYPERDESKLFHKTGHSQNQEASLRITQKMPDRSLLFDVKTDGYGKLCNFLNIKSKDCPIDEPFPKVGSTEEMRKVGTALRMVEIILYLLPFLVGWLMFKFVRKQTTTKNKNS